MLCKEEKKNPSLGIYKESAVIMGVGRAFARSLKILLFLTIFCARDLLHLKRCLITEVSCLSPRSNGKYLAHDEITNLCHAFVKRSGLGSHLGSSHHRYN